MKKTYLLIAILSLFSTSTFSIISGSLEHEMSNVADAFERVVVLNERLQNEGNNIDLIKEWLDCQEIIHNRALWTPEARVLVAYRYHNLYHLSHDVTYLRAAYNHVKQLSYYEMISFNGLVLGRILNIACSATFFDNQELDISVHLRVYGRMKEAFPDALKANELLGLITSLGKSLVNSDSCDEDVLSTAEEVIEMVKENYPEQLGNQSFLHNAANIEYMGWQLDKTETARLEKAIEYLDMRFFQGEDISANALELLGAAEIYFEHMKTLSDKNDMIVSIKKVRALFNTFLKACGKHNEENPPHEKIIEKALNLALNDLAFMREKSYNQTEEIVWVVECFRFIKKYLPDSHYFAEGMARLLAMGINVTIRD